MTSRDKIIESGKRDPSIAVRFRLRLPSKTTAAVVSSLGTQAAQAAGYIPVGPGAALTLALTAFGFLASDVVDFRD
ncbi:hypothetical protein GCM10011579_016740 [Streptomyces albiflavescens]|uniref:Uncharacterized protein n=1 Tax=Streptomyces albiflavescens TaxID=1623582 RepID=A0A917XVT8_9ACTN|nr:hypothetical protein [Streptomyces albiflavescens]GGN56064.1 hypothetical protein GCM10011579_016740 [Streptomyces albiflavescens]